MEHKNLRKTEGLPLYFGIASAVLILIYQILYSGVSVAYTKVKLSQMGYTYNISPVLNAVQMIIGYIIYPGIFLILLLLGANKPKRGSAFSIVWLIFSALSIISNVTTLFNASLRDLSNQMVPGGFYPYMIIGLLGYICMLVSCILMLKRLHTPEKLQEVSNEVSQNQ